jgi:hypothetical protein
MTRERPKRCRKCALSVKAPTVSTIVMVKPKGNKNAKPRPMVVTKLVPST